MESGAHIIVISEFTKNELYNFFPKFNGTIEVIHNGISKDWTLIENKHSLKNVLVRFNLPSDFLFSVGSLEPRKNFVSVFKVLAQAPKGKLPPLVLVMPDEWNQSSSSQLIKNLVKDKRLFILKDIDRSDLVALYNLALCLIYPSLYEGFGLPPLEAMACGCPVITSKNSALEELYQKAAVLIEPKNLDEIACAIELVVDDSQLRRKFIERGLSLSAKYSFLKMAEKTKDYFAAYA
jgi:glycosyltransferase involved in cell wall biosynthesis